MDFKEQYKHPNWQKRRLEILERDNFKCIECGCDNKKLNVHHKIYKKNAKIWEYDDFQLETLCDYCHELKHEDLQVCKSIISFMTQKKLDNLSTILFILNDITNSELDYELNYLKNKYGWVD